MSPNLPKNLYGFVTGCRELYFSSVGCHNYKKVGKHCVREASFGLRLSKALIPQLKEPGMTEILVCLGCDPP